MALEILHVAIRPDHTYQPIREQVTARFAGGGEQRAAVLSRTLGRWRLPLLLTEEDMAAVETFLESHGWGLTSFLWAGPQRDGDDARPWNRQDVAIANGDGILKTFALPVLGAQGGDYIDIRVPYQFADAGVPLVVDTIDRDARTVTFLVAPAGAITGTYAYLRRVRAAAGVTVADALSGMLSMDLELVEVPNG